MSTPRPVLGLLVLALLLGAPSRRARAEEDVVAEARRLIDAGTPEAARAPLEAALRTAEAEGAPAARRATLHALLAEALEAQGETYASLQHHERVVQLRGDPADQLRYGEALLRVAREHLAAGSTSSVEVLPFLLDALDAVARVGDADVALQPRRRVLEAESRYLTGDLDAAVRAWQQADLAALPPARAARQHDLLGHALYALGRAEEAAAAFRAAGNLRAEASAWAAARRPDETVETYARLLRAAPDDPDLLADAVAAARYVGREGALADVLATLEVEGGPARALVLRTRARLADAMGETEAAERLLEAALVEAPSDVDAHVDLGRLRARRALAAGDDALLDRALDAWIEALRLAPTHETVLALLWDQAGRDYTLAWRSLPARRRTLRIQEALVEADPEDPLAWANLGNTRRLAGDTDGALAAYEQAVSLAPEDAAIWSDRGLALSAAGRPEAALASFERALEVDPRFESADQNAARMLWLAGRDDDAARHLESALAEARRMGVGAARYRFLLERIARTRRHPERR